jgi:hypothetical protein
MRAHPLQTAVRVAQRAYLIWCTDVTGKWPWVPGAEWYHHNIFEKLTAAVSILFGLLCLAITLLAIATGRIRTLPYWPILLCVLIVAPIPYYFTQVLDDYSQVVRPWLALTAFFVIGQYQAKRAYDGYITRD